ncbi:MAG TPA: BrnT family toxin, partial [Candidatus Binatia bacterium]
MAESNLNALFAGVRKFGWNPKKRESNLKDHRVDFEDAKAIIDDYTFVRRSDRHGETRYQIFGYLEGQEITVACTLRGALCWIISARRASREERRKYYRRLAIQPS